MCFCLENWGGSTLDKNPKALIREVAVSVEQQVQEASGILILRR